SVPVSGASGAGCCAWASASDTVNTVAGSARANVASPRRERALRRGITSDLSLLIAKLLRFRGLTLQIRSEPQMNQHERDIGWVGPREIPSCSRAIKVDWRALR